jgi:hypothetical protein
MWVVHDKFGVRIDMIEFFLTFIILLAIVVGMAIGVMSGRKPIAGSCGGLKTLGMNGGCEICGGDASKCERQSPGDDS